MKLEALSNAFGPSGCEDEVRKIVLDAIRGKVDDVHVDHLGNVIAHQKGTAHPGTRVMVAAHMDEVGFMITHADDGGMLHFVKVGGIDDRVLPAKTVCVGKKRISGVLAVKPVHLTKPDERGNVIPCSQLAIDIGAKSKDEAGKHFKVGDYAVFDTRFEELGGVAKGKAFDDRVGCAVLIELIERGPYPVDFWPVFTTMEEVGARGARAAAYAVAPAAAFVLEGTICDDTPKEEDVSPTTRLGAGPAISVADRSAIADRRLLELVKETAEAEGIPYQFKQPGMGGTDAGTIHVTRAGVPSLPVSVPCRYIHSPVSIMSKHDFESTVALMAASLRRFTPDVVAESV